MWQTAGLAFITLMLGYLAVSGLRRWAERRQILDIPNERSSHIQPIPRGGGIAICTITLTGLIAYQFLDLDWSWSVLLAYSIGASLIAGVSWRDDLHSLTNWVRFSAHSVGALVAILGVGTWHLVSLPWMGEFYLGGWGWIVTFLWIVGLTNAYNFMDGIDGLAAGQAVVAGFGWAVVGWLASLSFVSIVGLLLAASSLGFLGHNWPPARIFMGDVGSAFLGYSFAFLPVVAARADPALAVVGVLLLWPFLFDTMFTFLRRLYHRENVFAAHRSHLYQRLVIAGATHRGVTLCYLVLAMVGVALALLWVMQVRGSSMAILLLLPLLSFTLWSAVVRRERQGVVGDVS